MSLTITTLVENRKRDDRYLAERGLSLLIHWQDKRILFDTGASEAFLENADTLGEDLSRLDYVVISHGHSDHSGGLRALCQSTRRKFGLVLNPQFFQKKFKREDAHLRYIGNDFAEEFLQIENIKTIFPMKDTFELIPGLYIISDFPRISFEKDDESFMALSGGEYRQDSFPEEQALVIDTPKGLVVFTGCAHNGIVNICETVKARLKKPVYAVLGGLRLNEADSQRIEKTAEYFRESGIAKFGSCHCAGESASACLAAACPEFLELTAGSVIVIE